MKKAVLVLEDGFSLQGRIFSGSTKTQGEVVFTTGMTGYQEVLTDPSYKGQLVTFTFPLIGNYGINSEDMESSACHLEGVILREYSPYPSHWRSEMSLKDFLEEHSITGIEGVDTRALTRHLREKGSLKGIISTKNQSIEELQKEIKRSPSISSLHLVDRVTCKEPYIFHKKGLHHVVVMDFGVKTSILKALKREGLRVTVVPANTSAKEILYLKPHGVLLSNGPGDPSLLNPIIEEVKELLGRIPIIGICLGHQILGMALGLEIFKMKFGHHGSNHPVQHLITKEVAITSQNHNYALKRGDGEFPIITHLNLNDGTVEGLVDPRLGVLSLQYHPEASPGPEESLHYFHDFAETLNQWHDMHCKKAI